MTSYLLVSQGRSTSPPSRSAVHTQPWAWLQTARRITSCGSTDARDYFSGAQSNFPAGAECAVCDCVVCVRMRALCRSSFVAASWRARPTRASWAEIASSTRARATPAATAASASAWSQECREEVRALIAYTGSCLVGEARRLVAVLDCCVYDS